MKKIMFFLVMLFAVQPLAAQEAGKFGLNFSVVGSGTSFASSSNQFSFGERSSFAPTLGFTYHFSNRFAIRPTFSLTQFSVDERFTRLNSGGVVPTLDTTITIKSVQLGVNLTALFYLTQSEGLSTYLGASLGYSEAQPQFTAFDSFSSTSQPDIYTVKFITKNAALLFGAQYALSKRFSFFGEVGFGYTSSEQLRTLFLSTPDTRPFRKVPSSQIGLTSTGVGVIFYLN
jgi:hypothetical protein